MAFDFEKYVKSGRSSKIANEAVSAAVDAAKAKGLQVEGYAATSRASVHHAPEELTKQITSHSAKLATFKADNKNL